MTRDDFEQRLTEDLINRYRDETDLLMLPVDDRLSKARPTWRRVSDAIIIALDHAERAGGRTELRNVEHVFSWASRTPVVSSVDIRVRLKRASSRTSIALTLAGFRQGKSRREYALVDAGAA